MSSIAVSTTASCAPRRPGVPGGAAPANPVPTLVGAGRAGITRRGWTHRNPLRGPRGGPDDGSHPPGVGRPATPPGTATAGYTLRPWAPRGGAPDGNCASHRAG